MGGVTTATPTRPVMRYHGGKFRLASWIVDHLPPHRLYVEPMCGSAAVLMAKPRSEGEVLADLDGEVVNVFRVLRDRRLGAELQRLIRLTPYAQAEFLSAYKPAADPVERARRTIVRSFMGHGSGAAGSARRHGFRRGKLTNRVRTPAADWATYPDAIAAFVERLAGVVVEEGDALETIRRYDGPDVLCFVDPPYLLSTRGEKRYRCEWGEAEHVELASVLHGIRGMAVLSGYPSRLYEDLYRGWGRVECDAMDASSTRRTEVLWLSPAAVARGRQLRMEGVA